MNWYRKAQEEGEEDLLGQAFEDVSRVAEEERMAWVRTTVRDAIMEGAKMILSATGLHYGMADEIGYERDVMDRVKLDAADPNYDITREAYLKRMAGLVAISMLMGQSIDSVAITSNPKEIDVIIKLMENGKITDKQDAQLVHEKYKSTFLSSAGTDVGHAVDSIVNWFMDYLPIEVPL